MKYAKAILVNIALGVLPGTFFCGSLLCQALSKHATVVVEVTDPGGAGVPSAEVKLSPPPQHFSGQLETTSDGRLTLKLKPGNYNLSVSHAGFKTFSKRFTVRETDEIQALSVGLQIASTGSPEVYPDEGIQVTVDATKQLAGPSRGRGPLPFPGSDSLGHFAGLPVRLELVVKAAELSPDGTILVDFLITNVDSGSVRLPSSVRPTSGSNRPYYLLTLWLTGDAIKKQYAVDQQTGRPFEIRSVQTSAELHDDSDPTPDSALLAPGATMSVHASSRAQVNLGSHSITAHAVLERIANGSAELLGTVDSETFRITFTETKP